MKIRWNSGNSGSDTSDAVRDSEGIISRLAEDANQPKVERVAGIGLRSISLVTVCVGCDDGIQESATRKNALALRLVLMTGALMVIVVVTKTDVLSTLVAVMV